MKKIISVSIIGCGSRGCNTYAKLMDSMKDKFKIVSLCDIKKEKLERYSKEYHVDRENCFDNDDEFFSTKRSDLIVIATPDKEHAWMAKLACKLGYSILLEKPISDSLDDLNELNHIAKENNSFVMVCHVLRYTWSNKTIMEILNSHRMGKLLQIDHTEQIGWWHFAHSYVRGNWRNYKVSTPMIMAKSCHDLDLLQEYAKSKVESLSSYGDLNLFKKENKPKEATSRCLDCKLNRDCPYSAVLKYIDEWHSLKNPQWWPFNVLSNEYLTDEVINDALRNGPYGRCVFECDNEVCDNQSLMIKFENGVQATFRVSAFTAETGRITIFNCTYGQIVYEESKGTIIEKPFGKEYVVHTFDKKDEFGHGGGDYGIVVSLYDALTNKNSKVDSSLENSIESHLMALAAEDSRKNNGKEVFLKDYRR